MFFLYRPEMIKWYENKPGYGVAPRVTNSYNRTPKDQMSDFTENVLYAAASGAVHLMGNLASENNHNTSAFYLF